jgi:hypothetical protein
LKIFSSIRKSLKFSLFFPLFEILAGNLPTTHHICIPVAY